MSNMKAKEKDQKPIAETLAVLDTSLLVEELSRREGVAITIAEGFIRRTRDFIK